MKPSHATLETIRAFYETPQTFYRIHEAVAILALTMEQFAEWIDDGKIELTSPSNGSVLQVSRDEMLQQMEIRYSPRVIHEALGDSIEKHFPPSRRPCTIALTLPAYMLEEFERMSNEWNQEKAATEIECSVGDWIASQLIPLIDDDVHCAAYAKGEEVSV